MKIQKATLVRTILLAIAIINSFLTSRGSGFNLFMNEELAGVLADLFIAVMSLITFWYNNSFTKEAIEADEYLKSLKQGTKDTE